MLQLMSFVTHTPFKTKTKSGASEPLKRFPLLGLHPTPTVTHFNKMAIADLQRSPGILHTSHPTNTHGPAPCQSLGSLPARRPGHLLRSMHPQRERKATMREKTLKAQYRGQGAGREEQGEKSWESRVTRGHGMQGHLVKRESGNMRRAVQTREDLCDRQETTSTGC